MPNLINYVFFVVALLLFGAIIKLHHFVLLRLQKSNYYDHKVNNYYIIYKWIIRCNINWKKCSLINMSKHLNLIKLNIGFMSSRRDFILSQVISNHQGFAQVGTFMTIFLPMLLSIHIIKALQWQCHLRDRDGSWMAFNGRWYWDLVSTRTYIWLVDASLVLVFHLISCVLYGVP